VPDEPSIRVAAAHEVGDLVALAGRALGWRSDEPNEELFRWKHLDGPFGPSPLWVAEVDGKPIGLRVFLRWEWEATHGGRFDSVRAVDTATDPAFQGRGVFRALTLHALDDLRAAGVDFVFNTPNDQSRPGYLSMGWRTLGRVPVGIRPRGWGGLARTARARTAAEKWSLATSVGEDARAVFADGTGVDELLDRVGPPVGLRTRRTAAFLRWRYGLGSLRYRVLLRTGRPEDGLVVFRLRRRGAAVEATLCDLLAPAGDRAARRDLVGLLHRHAPADYVIGVQQELVRSGPTVRLPGQGPVLTWRAVAVGEPPAPFSNWSLCLGDVELF
jgi:GNAT superfamily N-acetyltransferase